MRRVLRAIGRGIAAWARGLALCVAWGGLGVVQAVASVLLAASIVLSFALVGLLLLPAVVTGLLWLGALAARLAAASGAAPFELWRPRRSESTVAGRAQQILTDPGTWRALGWGLAALALGLVALIAAIVPGLNLGAARLAGCTCRVLLRRRATPAVDDEALGAADAPEPAARAGHGLLGMSERVDMLGGTLHTGPTPDGGFEVHARLPIGDPDDAPRP